MKMFVAIITALIVLGSSAMCQEMMSHKHHADSTNVEKPIAHKHLMDSTKVEKYTCPMHPEIISHKPGKCPKCGMTLVKVEAKKVKEETKKPNDVKADMYTCPMHPEVKSDRPGRCPKCKMDLVKENE